MKETTSFKWTREDGKFVTIENNVMRAFDADGTELPQDSDDAIDLFMEFQMVMDETMMLAHPENMSQREFYYELHKSFRCLPPPCCGPMFGGFFRDPRSRRMMCDDFERRPGSDRKSEEELAYEFRKDEIKHMQRERQIQREREAKRQQQIIDTAIPYEVTDEKCPRKLITDNNKYYIEQNGNTIVDVGHDINNKYLHNIVDKEHRFLLKRHQMYISRIVGDRFVLTDENDVRTYMDVKENQVLFRTEGEVKNFDCGIPDGIAYSTDEKTFIYDYNGNLLATVPSEYRLQWMIGGRPVVKKTIDKGREYEYFYNIVLGDGTFMFDENAIDKIKLFGHNERFAVQRKDGICEIYSVNDFKKVYESEKPRHIDECHNCTRDCKDIFIFFADDTEEKDTYGILVNVMTGEVVKDKDGNQKEFKNIEYPSWANNNHWRAELSEKTRRMETIDPMTGKRARANRKK